jgi:probable F420-dependent oxidoreductase
MKIDGALSMSLRRSGAEAASFEAMGLDGAWSFEGSHDPFVPLTLASQTTDRIELGTAIAVAYARTPMTTAHTAWDLQRLSGGRFILGLGTQIKPHIEKRYGMPWSKPAARMREYVQALRAIWDSWSTGDKLDFRGDFYTHTLMTPFFSPGPNEAAPPPVYVAGVGPHMVRVIGEVADGFFVHPFHSPEFLHAETLPALAEGASAIGRDPAEVEIACLTIVAMGTNDEELADARTKAKAQLAFYGSTPAYAGVLEHHGYDGLQAELNAMSKQGRWRDMTDRIDDDLLELIAVTGSAAEVGRKLAARNVFANRSTMMFYGPQPSDESITEAIGVCRDAAV